MLFSGSDGNERKKQIRPLASVICPQTRPFMAGLLGAEKSAKAGLRHFGSLIDEAFSP
jgi:hypothetical protein